MKEEEEEESQRKSESKQTYVLGHIQAGALRVGRRPTCISPPCCRYYGP